MVMARNLLDTSWRRQDLVDTDMVGLEVFDCVEGLRMDEELEADRSVTDELQRLEETRKREETESSVVRWEEYMPKMVIRVLLVEADDSTRQIIAALLRKCNYKVAAIPDGLKAWEILKQRHSNIDLILTEVDLPSISGYALLTLIMEHDGCKKIPVIMMSSCDSMTTVFKCMLKGAADFLIKPVRRNELKNLWQHVWRRLFTNNEQGQQNSPSGHCNIKETSKSREPRSHSDDDASSSLKISHFAYKANDAQVALEQAEVSALRNGHWERDSSTSMISRNGTDEVVGSQGHVISMRQGVVDGCRTEKDAEDKNPELKRSIAAVDDHGKKQQYTRDAIEAVDLIGRIDHHGNCNSLYGFYPNYSDLHNSAVPGLELSLRRSEDLEDPATSLKKRKLNHVSAFARYNSGRNSEDIESTARFSSPEDAPTRSLYSLNALSNEEENHRPHLAMNPSKTNTDLMDDESQIRLVLLPGFKFDSVYPPPMSESQTTKIQAALSASKLTNTKEPSSFLLNSPTSLHSDPVGSLMGQSGEISNQEHNITISGEDQQQQHPQQQHPQQQQHQQQKQEIYAKQHGGCQTSITGNNSAVCSGSSDGLTNKSTITATTTTAEEELVNDNGTISTNNMPMHCDHQLPRGKGSLFSPQRVAALAKFRQKRKDRCFEKKVRYQSRKRLAEQRPRVKGQFVRQLVNEQPNGDDAGQL